MSIYSRERALSGALHYLGGRAAGGIASFLTIVLTVRYMSTLEYAAYTALTGLVMLGVNVSSLGLERAIARYVPEGVVSNRPAEVATFIYRVSLLRAVAAVGFALLSAFLWQRLTGWFGILEMNSFPFSIALAVIGGSIFQLQCSVFQALMRQHVLARVMIAQWGSRLLLTLFYIYTGNSIGLSQAIWILAVPEVLGALVSYFAIKEAVNSHVQATSTGESHTEAIWPKAKHVIEVAGFNYTYELLATPPQGQIMRMVIAALCPPQFVAAYGFFQSLAEKARQYLPTQVLYLMVEPFLIAKYIEHGNAQALQQRTRFLYVMNLLILMPAIAVVVGSGESLTTMLTGGRYSDYWWLLIPALLQLIFSTQIVLQKIALTALDATRTLIAAAMLGLVFFGASLFIVVGLDAINAIPFVPLIYFVMVIGYLSGFLKKAKCDVSISVGLWLKLLFLMAVAVALAAYLSHEWVASAALATAACTLASLLVFAGGTIAMGIVNRGDLRRILGKPQNGTSQ